MSSTDAMPERGWTVALTVASAPSRCPVCRGSRRVLSLADGVIDCPHCARHIPIAHLPMRVDHPIHQETS